MISHWRLSNGSWMFCFVFVFNPFLSFACWFGRLLWTSHQVQLFSSSVMSILLMSLPFILLHFWFLAFPFHFFLEVLSLFLYYACFCISHTFPIRATNLLILVILNSLLGILTSESGSDDGFVSSDYVFSWHLVFLAFVWSHAFFIK